MPHRPMRAVINTIKHYVHRTNIAVASGGLLNEVAAESVVAPATAASNQVKEGSVIKAVHLEYWLWGAGPTGVDTQFVMIVEKVPSAQASVTAAQLLNLGAYPNKKNILFSSQGVLGAGIDGSQAVPIIRDWVLIPKGKQRMGLSDKIVTSFTSVGTSLQICGLSTYKEQI